MNLHLLLQVVLDFKTQAWSLPLWGLLRSEREHLPNGLPRWHQCASVTAAKISCIDLSEDMYKWCSNTKNQKHGEEGEKKKQESASTVRNIGGYCT